MNKRLILVPALLLALVIFASPAAAQDDYDWKPLPLLHEIRGFGDTVFTDVRGAALNTTRNQLGILQGGPLRISLFRPDRGQSLREIPLTPCDKPDCPQPPPDDARPLLYCNNATYTFASGALYIIRDDGSTQSRVDITPPQPGPTWVRRALCAGKNRLWLLLGSPRRLLLVDTAGKTLADIKPGPCSPAPGAVIKSLDDIALERNGRLLLADADSGNLKRFAPDGKYIDLPLRPNTADPRRLARPALIAVDPRGNIWAFDAADRSLKIFDSLGHPLGQIADSDNTGFRWLQPVWIDIDLNAKLLLLDRNTRVLRIFDATAPLQ